MSENVTERKRNNNVIEIDVKRLWQAVWHRLWIIGIVAILCAALALAGTMYLITPLYQASAMFYVNNSSISVGNTSLSISQGDLTAAQDLVETYMVILGSRTCLNDVIDYANLDQNYEELKDMISASSVNETEIFRVIVTSPDPTEAEQIANAIAYILPKRIASIVEGTSAKVVDYAIRPAVPSSPSHTKNTAIGLAAGLLLAVGVIVLQEIFDVTIRSEDDIERCCNHPILAAVPDMVARSKGSSYYNSYGYGAYGNAGKKGKKKYKPLQRSAQKEPALIGKDISFAASEAYKLLRTKLQFSFVDGTGCPVIGVSSAMAGEGKSLTSVNLAYSLSQLNKRTLIVDCDMRRPSLAAKLQLQKVPGLSNYLTGQIGMDQIVQHYSGDTEEGFYVISSGRNPPNPIELLTSQKMESAIQELRNHFDYIILDLPPVGEVSDAIAVAKMVDGILFVVRQDYCNTVALNGAIRQFEFVEAKIFGIVMNCVGDGSGRYYNRYYGKRYYKRYYRSYYSKYSYAAASAKSKAKNNEVDASKE